MKLAYFSPLRPQRSGISDYSEELLPHLSTEAELTLFVNGFQPRDRSLNSGREIVDIKSQPQRLNELDRFDAIIYHLGNDHRYHAWMLEAMAIRPGIVVFHDFALQDFFLGLARDKRDLSYYLDEVDACHGKQARAEAAEALNRGADPAILAQPLEFPLNCRIANSAEGIIVHSEFTRARFSKIAPGVPVAHIAMPIGFPEVAVDRFHNDKDEVCLASFGLITPGKGIERALRALSILKSKYRFRYSLVGEPNSFYDVRELIQRYEMADRVEITGHISLAEFKRRMNETDIALNLRERTVGETSASLCRLMAGGVCSIVADVGWYAELPGDSVVKVTLDSYLDKLLLAYLERLIQDEPLRRQIGANARQYAHAEHAPERAGANYLAFIREVIGARPRRQLIKGTCDELAQLGIRAGDEKFLRNVAAELDGLIPTQGNGNSAAVLSDQTFFSPSVAPDNLGQSSNGRMRKVEGIDYKRAAIEYVDELDAERQHYLLTKPFYNLANKPPKHEGEGMDAETFRHFCDFANMAVALALPAGSSILDVGCGSGWLSEYFARLGYEVKGIDISPALIEMSRRRLASIPFDVDHQTKLCCAFAVHDIEAGPLDEKFDAVVCYDSLHHFEDERAVMRNLAAMLEIGGVLFILEGQRPSEGSSTETELLSVMERYRTLESPFDYSYLHELLNENGFAIIGDYVSVNGLFERESILDQRLPLEEVPTNYHYLACKKVAEGAPASTVPDSRQPGKLSARIALRNEPPSEFLSGETLQLDLDIENTGDTLWLAGREARNGIVMPALRIIDENGRVVREVHGEPPLPHAVAPGEVIHLKIEHAAPLLTGPYTIRIDLVDEQVCWFADTGSEALAVRIIVLDDQTSL
jgi:SAM-dependent methyltransferase/glycosyltransferase involved in cell wall biosynthesis